MRRLMRDGKAAFVFGIRPVYKDQRFAGERYQAAAQRPIWTSESVRCIADSEPMFNRVNAQLWQMNYRRR
jgi:hypothetical protein